MWIPMSNPLINLMSPPKLILGIAQVGIVTNCKEPSDEDEDYFEREHNPMMPQIISIKKLYHEQKARPSPIGDVGKLPTNGQVVPISKSGGVPFDDGGNGPLGGGDGGPLGSGGGNLLRSSNNSPLGGNNISPPRVAITAL